MKILVTGGAGFIGSAVCRYLIDHTADTVINLDDLTYAGDSGRLAALEGNPRYRWIKANICDAAALEKIFAAHQPDAVMHLAAESHVDRSIDHAGIFIETNVVGTFRLLEASRAYWGTLDGAHKASFRFHHVSTDEVYGSLGDHGSFDEDSVYAPNSPYAASKASSDHLARAWHHTFGLPVLISNCSNNYGPWQFPEKLIPLILIKALHGERLPVYGTGANVRDWLHVEDHARALHLVLTRGLPGEKYNVGGNAERRNLDLVRMICALLDELLPASPHRPHERLIDFVPDRPGHDHRYAIDASRIKRDLGWEPHYGFEDGLRQTIRWYRDNQPWWTAIQARSYDGRRLGLDRPTGSPGGF